MSLSLELKPHLQKVMVVYSVYMRGVKQGEVYELQSQKATLLLMTLYNTLMSCDTLFEVSDAGEGIDGQGMESASTDLVICEYDIDKKM